MLDLCVFFLHAPKGDVNERINWLLLFNSNACVSPESCVNCRSLSVPGPGSVSFVQCRCVCGRKLSLLSLHLSDTSLSTYVYKQQFIGVCWILAVGTRSNIGKLVWTHQYTLTLSSWSVQEFQHYVYLNLSAFLKKSGAWLHICQDAVCQELCNKTFQTNQSNIKRCTSTLLVYFEIALMQLMLCC